jgi:hypothetical protein
MKDATQDDAWAWAVSKWSKSACVRFKPGDYRIGFVKNNGGFFVVGEGDTWASAIKSGEASFKDNKGIREEEMS